MRYRSLGSTGIRVSEVGFGAWAIGGTGWGPQDDLDSRLALHRALDEGCCFIDTALAYGNGHSERLIGAVMRERGERPAVATKVPPKNRDWDNPPGTPLSEAFPADWVVSKTEESLRNLGLDCVDVLQLHTWHGEWNAQAGPLLSAVARLKRDGKIRAFGLSLRDKGPDEADDLVRWRQVDSLQIFFNLLYQEPLRRAFPLARAYGVGVIARVPLAFGALTGRFTPQTRFPRDDHRSRLYEGEGLRMTLKKVEKLKFLASKTLPLAEAALKWTLAYPEVSTSIPGIRNPRQARLNCSAGDGAGISPAQARKAEALYRRNFGLAVKSVPSDAGVHAVFLSGVKADAPRAGKPRKTASPRGASRKKAGSKKAKKARGRGGK